MSADNAPHSHPSSKPHLEEQFQVLNFNQEVAQLPTVEAKSTQTQPAQPCPMLPSSGSPSQLPQSVQQLSDELLKYDKQENSATMCAKCCKCQQLQQKLDNSLSDNKVLQQNLMQATVELNQLRRVLELRKEETVDKGQLNFCVDSLKEIIKSFEEQNEKLVHFVTTTLKIHKKEEPGATYKLIESVVSDFISNWHQIDRELTHLMVLSSPSGEASVPKQDNFKYNFCQISSKLDRVKENVIELQKRLKYQ